jgi:hypothetical protein
MKNFLTTFLLFAGLLLFSTCHKNDDDVQPDKEYLYIINLQAVPAARHMSIPQAFTAMF